MKMKLKKEVKLFLIGLLIGIFVLSYAINKYNEYKYQQTNEYKLTISGYTIDEAKKLEKVLSDKNVEKLINKKKNEFVLSLIDEKYFMEKNYDRYINYFEGNEDTSISDVVAIVNVGADREWYEELKEVDMSKGTAMLVNKFHTLNNYSPDDLENISFLNSNSSILYKTMHAHGFLFLS